MLRRLLKKENLYIRIAIGFCIGIILGLFLPELAIETKMIGTIYLKIIKYMVVPILICAVSTAMLNSAGIVSLRRVGAKTILLYIVMFLFSFAVTFGAAMIIRPGLNINFENKPVYEGAVGGTISFSSILKGLIPKDIVSFFSAGNVVAAIILAMVFSIIIIAMGEKGSTVKAFMNKASDAMFFILGIVMEISPLGVMSLVAVSIAEYGTGIFMAIGKYIICAWVSCALVFVIVFLIPVRLYAGVDIRSFLRACGKIALMTLSTTSSAATLPTTIRVSIDDLGAPESISKFTLPIGCTINMCGGAVSFCCLAVFVSDFYSLNLPIAQLALMAIVATLLNMAAPGIPGGGVVLMTSYLSIFNLPLDLIGPIAAVYRLLDMAYTTINVEGDVAANLIISKSEGLYAQ